MPATLAAVQVTLSPNTEVNLGDSTTIACQYTGISSSTSLVVKWSHKSTEDVSSESIWTYDGGNNMDGGTGVGVYDYSRVDTDVTKEHVIRLKSAKLDHEGEYFCNLEYYGDGYFEVNGKMEMTVIGKL